MTILNVIYRNGLVLSVPFFALSAALLAFFCIDLVRLGDRARLASLPLLEQQTVRISEAGRVVLSLEGPRLSKRFAELTFDLVSPEGAVLAARTTWFHASSRGVSTVRMELLSFSLDRPGEYVLRARNLGAARDEDSRHRIVLSRPQLPRMAGLVLGIILSAGLLIGSVVLFVLRLLNKGGAS